MSKNFTSIVKLVDTSREGDCHAPQNTFKVSADGREISLPPSQPLPLGPSSKNKLVSLCFDKILSAEVPGPSLYKQSIKEVVESVLLGYHGTVLALGSAETRQEKSDSVWNTSQGITQNVASHIFRCLKKTKQAKTKSSASNLIVLCSYIMVLNEEVRDLLFEGLSEDDDLPPKLTVSNGILPRASQHIVKAGKKVGMMLRSGKEMQARILSHTTTKSTAVQNHSSIFTLTVEYSQFGTINAPVSGTFSLVDLGDSNPLGHRQKHMIGDRAEASVQSLFTFADVVESLTPNVAEYDASMLTSTNSAFNLENDSSFHPCVPSTTDNNLHSQSVLTQLIKESLGGNCKALLITYSPSHFNPSSHSSVFETLKIASRARIIQNTPNKRDLAEKALMSAYLRGLQEMYGKDIQKREAGEGCEEDEEMGTDTEEDTEVDRQRNMELAATALVVAALDGEEEEEEEEDSSSEIEDGGGGSSTSGRDSDGGNFKSEGRRKISRRKSKMKQKPSHQVNDKKTFNMLVPLTKDQNVTLNTLLALLQDPDEGVDRPSHDQLRNVKIKKDAGGLFSGAAIVKWFTKNVSGVKSEEDAQKLGQLLLENGHILHTEGSRVFANAESLFYHVQHTRSKNKFLSQDEILNLLEDAYSQDNELERNVLVNADDQLLQQHKSGSMKTFLENECGVKVDAVDGGEATNTREEWMIPESEEEERKEEEGEKERENEIDADAPYTAPLEKIPSLHTLENTENYPHPLHMAAAIGKSPGVIRELVMMFGVDKLDNSHRTPLMFAALGNNKRSSCQTLIKCSADVNKQDSSGLTALHVACYHGNKSAASILLANKASIAEKDNAGQTSLHWSMIPDDTKCIEILTHYTIHSDLLNFTDNNGLTAIHWSIFYSHPHHLNILLKKCNKSRQINLTELDREGRTLAIYAIEKHSLSCLEVLLNAEPSLLMLPDKRGSYLSHYASIQSSSEYIKALVNYRPPKKSQSTVAFDVDVSDQHQRTSLHYAVAGGRLEIARDLISKGARVDVEDNEGKTAMNYATELENRREEMDAVLRGESIVTDEVADLGATTISKSANSTVNSSICTLV